MNNKVVKFLQKKFSALFFLLLGALGLYVLLVRLACFYLGENKSDLESLLSTSLERITTIKSLDSSWVGFDPVIDVNGLSIDGSEHSYIGRVRIRFSFIDSLKALSPVIKSVSLQHSELSLYQSTEGDWRVASFSLQDLESQSDTEISLPGGFIESLIGKTQFQVNDLQVSIHDAEGHVRSLRLPSTSLAYQEDKVFINGSVLEKGADATLLNFSLEGEGVLDSRPLRTRVYVEARSSEFFGRLLKVYQWEDISVDDINGNIRLWFDIAGINLKAIQGQIQVSQLDWHSSQGPLPSLNNIASDFVLTREEELSVVDIMGLNYQVGDLQCASSDIRVKNSPNKVLAKVSTIDLECLSNVALPSGLLSKDLSERLNVSKPKGLLNNLNLSANTGDKVDFLLEAELSQLALDAYDGTPAGSGIDGYIKADIGGGFVNFSSDNFTLAFPDLFSNSWETKLAEGTVHWGLHENGDVDVYSDGLRLWFDDESVVYGDFSLSLNDDEHEDYLSLALAMQNIQFSNVTNFVPGYIVGEDLNSWLRSALVSGVVNSGIYWGNGSIESDEASNSFTSSLLVNTVNGKLLYDEHWPMLEELNAEIVLQNEQLEIQAPTARVADSTLNNISAVLGETPEGVTSRLEVSSSSIVDPSQVVYWLEESPIAEQTKEISKQLEIEGDIEVEIGLLIPVSDGEDSIGMEHKIIANLSENKVSHVDSKITFSSVVGAVEVSSDKGVYASAVELDAFGHPAVLDISTSHELDSSAQYVDFDHDNFEKLSSTIFSLKGLAGIKDVFSFFGYQQTAMMDGDFSYQAIMNLPNHSYSFPTVTIESDLIGVSRAWPYPLSKLSADDESLNVKLHLKPSQMFVGASLDTHEGAQLGAELLFVNESFSFGEISLNGAEIQNPKLSGLNIAANVENARIEDWVHHVDALGGLDWNVYDMQEKDVPNTEGSELTTGYEVASGQSEELKADLKSHSATVPGADDGESLIKNVELNVDKASYGSYIFSQTYAEIQPSNGSWIIKTAGNDVSGVVTLPYDENILDLDFAILKLNSDTTVTSLDSDTHKEGDQEKDSSETLSISDLPELNFAAKDFTLEGTKFGALSLAIEKTNNRAVFKDIGLSLPGSEVEGQLSWESMVDGGNHSIFTGTAKGDDFSNIFALFGVTPLFSSDSYSSEIGITWPEDPLGFELGKLSGRFKLNADEGFLNTDDSETGLLRLFGVLNAEAIVRRLKLDFSDLYKSGVGFDQLSLDASIDQGLLQLNSPLKIEGPTGDYAINGVTDLASETLDLDMLVELPFSQNVPLAALVLGAPQIGGLVWVADKLLGEPLSALTTSRYDISGTWDKPVIELKQAVNAVKKDREEAVQRVSPGQAESVENAKKSKKKPTAKSVTGTQLKNDGNAE